MSAPPATPPCQGRGSQGRQTAPQWNWKHLEVKGKESKWGLWVDHLVLTSLSYCLCSPSSGTWGLLTGESPPLQAWLVLRETVPSTCKQTDPEPGQGRKLVQQVLTLQEALFPPARPRGPPNPTRSAWSCLSHANHSKGSCPRPPLTPPAPDGPGASLRGRLGPLLLGTGCNTLPVQGPSSPELLASPPLNNKKINI